MITDRYNLSPDVVIEILRRLHLFRGFPDNELRALAETVKGIKAGAGDRLFEEGDHDDKFYVVTEGSVEILKHVRGGGEEKLAVRRAGEVFGEMAVLNDAPRSATARAAEECECLTLSREDFEALMGKDSFAFRMVKVLSQALGALDTRFVNLERVDERPVTSGGDAGRSVRLERPLPRWDGFDIAVGTTPNSSGIELSAWETLSFSDERVGLMALAVQGDRLRPLHQLAVARAFFNEFSLAGEPAETLFARVNDSLYRDQVHALDQFVAVAMLVPQSDAVLWSSAGGIHGAILRSDGTVSEFPSDGPPLGMMAGFQHGVEEIPMVSGDVILVLSAVSRGHFRGAVHALSNLQKSPAGEVVERVQQAVRGAQGSDPDQTTVLFLRRH